jgi:hypothetical protein
MAVPVVESVGGVVTGTTTCTPTMPAGAVAGHFLVTLLESVGNQVFTLPTGWAHLSGSPVNLNTTTRLTVGYRFMQGGDTAPAWALPGGNHAIGRMVAISGVRATGNPWDVIGSPATESIADTTATWNAVTTTQADCLILLCIATGRDSTAASLGAVTGGTGLTNFVEHIDNFTNLGTGGGIGLVTAEKLTAGTTGTPGATMGSTDGKALLTVALAPAPAAPSAPPPILVMPTMD